MANQFPRPGAPRLTPLTAWTPKFVAAVGCEMGDEGRCPNIPTCALWSEAYVKPMFCCEHHADLESFYHGAIDYTTPAERLGWFPGYRKPLTTERSQ